MTKKATTRKTNRKPTRYTDWVDDKGNCQKCKEHALFCNCGHGSKVNVDGFGTSR